MDEFLSDELHVEVFLRKATGLVKEIGPIGAFALPWLAMAGGGITFYAVQVIYSAPNGSVVLSFLIAGVPAVLSAAVIALLGITTPRSAGGYVWTSRYVDPFLGWFGAGWLYWISMIFSIGILGYVMASTTAPVLLVIMGSAAKIQALTNFALALQTNTGLQAGFMVSIIILMGIVTLIELKHYMKVMFALWALNSVALVVSVILFATNNIGTIPSVWNSVWGAGSYETIVNLATKYDLAGYVASTPSGLWNGTLLMTTYIFWALTGWEANAYVAGEVRNPKASFLYWYLAGTIATVVWYAVVAWYAYYSYGDFILKYNFVYNLYTGGKLAADEAAKVAPYMMTPSMPLFAASLSTLPIVQVLAASWFWPVTSGLTNYLTGTRVMFGMSFDRMFPETFGSVSERTHTPLRATIFVIIISIIWASIQYTQLGYLVSAANATYLMAFMYLLFSVAAIMLPYKRPDIWQKGITKKVFGIPLISLLGGISAAAILWIMALSTIGISLVAWNVTTLWMFIGILIFIFYARKSDKRGIKIGQIFAEIPPP